MESRKLFPVVCLADEAIDPDESDLDKYGRERDMSLLKFLPGELPTIFHTIRLPTNVVLRSIEPANTESDKYTLAFMFGVAKVENYVQEGRKQPYTWTPERALNIPTGKLSAVSEEELSMFSPAEVLGVGSVIYQRAFLARAKRPFYVPQPTSVAACGARIAAYRLAAATRELREPNEKAPELQDQKPEQSTDEPTAAPATENPICS